MYRYKVIISDNGFKSDFIYWKLQSDNITRIKKCSNSEALRGLKGIDFEIEEYMYNNKKLSDCIRQLYICNIDTDLEDKTKIYYLLYG